MKPKRQPLLIDRYLASDQMRPLPFNRRKVEIVRDHLYAAKRFVLDDNAVRYMAEMVRNVPEAIAAAQEFAIPPFPVTYIEIPNFPLWYEIVSGKVADMESDGAVGYLYAGPRVYALADSRLPHVKGAMLGPIEYRLNQPFTPEERERFCRTMNIKPIDLDAFTWGAPYKKVPEHMHGAFTANHSWQFIVQGVEPEKLLNFMNGSAADLRNMIAMLLFMNTTSKLRYEEEIGPHRAMIGNKPRTFLTHSIVRINVNPLPHIKRVLRGGMSGKYRREHEVRGHFCHDKTAHAHEHTHEWVEYGVHQWRCKLCQGLRWWRRNHRRGSRERGVVRTDYEVTANTRKEKHENANA